MVIPEDTLKDSRASTKIELMWRGKNIVLPYFSIQDNLSTL